MSKAIQASAAKENLMNIGCSCIYTKRIKAKKSDTLKRQSYKHGKNFPDQKHRVKSSQVKLSYGCVCVYVFVGARTGGAIEIIIHS